MKYKVPSLLSIVAVVALLLIGPTHVLSQSAAGSPSPSLTWDQVKIKFEAANPDLKADALGVDEMKAQEITAFLRPNPTASFTMDQLYPFGPHYDPNESGTRYRPLSNALTTGSISYLYEREHKRDLRLLSAKEGTRIAGSQHEDLERNLLFTLRSAFVDTLQSKAVLELAKADLTYYDRIIQISHDRLRAGDIAQIDLDRIELLRVQYEVEIQTASVNLRTAKILLLQLLNDRTPVERFDVTGPFDFSDDLKPLDEFRQTALDARPDLRAALEAIQQAQTNRKLAQADGSADPTFSVDSGANPPLDPYVGFNINIPLRIFDRNQGEKQRTQIEISRSEQLTEAARAQVFSDVDSAYSQLESNLALLRPYKAQYNAQALRVRDTVTYSYQHGGASLMDFLNAQSDCRVVQLAYLQLIGSYLTAGGQLNLAVGREVIQ
ncbi:MAG: TolC family protein [Terracidiphilus sp.]|jgi:cobalt-zinc-cadmium efflux system outer membrane protein